MLPPEQIGAVPQQQSMNSQVTPDQIESLRGDPDVQKAIEMFVGRPVNMAKIEPEIIKEVAGMVHKLGIEGAVQMATKMLPQDIQQKIRQGASSGPNPA